MVSAISYNSIVLHLQFISLHDSKFIVEAMLALRDLSTAFYAHIFVSNPCLKKVTRHDTDVKLKVCQKWHTFGVYGKIIQVCQKWHIIFCVKHLSQKMTQHDTCQIEGVSKVLTHFWCVRGIQVCQKWQIFWSNACPKKDTTWNRCQIKGVSKVTHFGVSLQMCRIHCVSKMAQ